MYKIHAKITRQIERKNQLATWNVIPTKAPDHSQQETPRGS
jgi:hypothetical protein